MRLEPGGYSEAVAGGEVDIVLVTNRNFPAGKYDLEVVFGKDAPPELSGRLTNLLNGRRNKKPADASNAGNDRSYLLRDIKNNLDLGGRIHELHRDDQGWKPVHDRQAEQRRYRPALCSDARLAQGR